MIKLPSPEAAREGARGGGGGRCLLDPKTCGIAKSLSEQAEEIKRRESLQRTQK